MTEKNAFIPANIEEMKNSILRGGLVFTNRYEVLITPPMGVNWSSDDQRHLSVRCDSISIPGRSLATNSYRLYAGPARQLPTSVVYGGDMTASIILSEDMRERSFINDWMSLIVNPQTYKFSHYDTYTTNISIRVLNRSDQCIREIILEETYPKSMADIEMGYEKDNEIAKMSVVFAYRKYFDIPLPRIDTSTNNI